MEVKVVKLQEEAILPVYATDGSGCFDIYTINEGLTRGGVFNTGLAFEIPEGHVMLIFSRSGDGFKKGVRLANCVGVIDSDYRGELRVKLHQEEGRSSYWKNAGERVAQGLIVPIPRVKFTEVTELSSTERGLNGFGSTGL